MSFSFIAHPYILFYSTVMFPIISYHNLQDNLGIESM